MHTTRPWLFALTRHEGGDGAGDGTTGDGKPATGTGNGTGTGDGDGDGDGTDPGDKGGDGTGSGDRGDPDALGDKGKRALDAMKVERAAAKKEAAELRAKLAEYEDRDKTDAQRAADRAEAAEKRAAELRRRALVAEIKAAAEGWADPEDAPRYLDLAAYGDDDIDTDKIKTDLAAVLDAKPHLRKATNGAPNLHQGARPPGQPIDYRTASKEDVAAKARQYGIRLRS